MTTYHCRDLDDCMRMIERHAAARDKRCIAALRKAAAAGARVVRAHAPKNEGALRDSIHDAPRKGGAAIVADAPYARLVEEGTRPHRPPLRPLLEWVIARRLASSVRDAFRIARAIQNKIARDGTQPSWFMRASQPEILELLMLAVAASLPDP